MIKQIGETFTFKTSLKAILKRRISFHNRSTSRRTSNFHVSTALIGKSRKNINKLKKRIRIPPKFPARATRSLSSFENNRVNARAREIVFHNRFLGPLSPSSRPIKGPGGEIFRSDRRASQRLTFY